MVMELGNKVSELDCLTCNMAFCLARVSIMVSLKHQLEN